MPSTKNAGKKTAAKPKDMENASESDAKLRKRQRTVPEEKDSSETAQKQEPKDDPSDQIENEVVKNPVNVDQPAKKRTRKTKKDQVEEESSTDAKDDPEKSNQNTSPGDIALISDGSSSEENENVAKKPAKKINSTEKQVPKGKEPKMTRSVLKVVVTDVVTQDGAGDKHEESVPNTEKPAKKQTRKNKKDTEEKSDSNKVEEDNEEGTNKDADDKIVKKGGPKKTPAVADDEMKDEPQETGSSVKEPAKKQTRKNKKDAKEKSDSNKVEEETNKNTDNAKIPKRGGPKKTQSIKEAKEDEVEDAAEETSSNPEEPARKRNRRNKKDAETKEEKSDEEDDDEDVKKEVEKKKPAKKGGKTNVKAKASEATTSQDGSSDDFEPDKLAKKTGAKPKTTSKAASSSKEETAPKPPNRSILQLKINLTDSNPEVWRRIQVLNNDTFANLRDHIDEAMGWFGPQWNYFIAYDQKKKSEIRMADGSRQFFGDEDEFRKQPKQENIKLSKFLNAKGDRVIYEYGAADTFFHDVVVEKVLPPPPPKAEYPKCTGGKGTCPPGDIHGIDEFNHLVKVFKDPKHDEYEELITGWLEDMNPGWNPDQFDKKKVFKRVRQWVYCGP